MKKLICLIALITLSAPAWAEGVVVSIKPLHSLVAAVMEGDGRTPLLLVNGKASVHSFALKPSQLHSLARADVVFYMGDHFELFLPPVLNTLPASLKRAPMENAPDLTLYPLRADGNDGHHHAGAYDLHLWLSPANAKAMVADIAATLSALYPTQAALYQTNAQKLVQKLDALDSELKTRLAPLQDKPFIAFHDAYQYLEKSYGLRFAGAVTLMPERTPGARHIRELRETIEASGARCAFREPEFDGRIVDNMLEGLDVESGVLDPEGAQLAPGPELYFQLMESLAASLEECLTSP